MRRRLSTFSCENSGCKLSQNASAYQYSSTTSIVFGPFDFSGCVGVISAQIEYKGLRPDVDIEVAYVNYVSIHDTSTTRIASVVENNSVTIYGIGFFSSSLSDYLVNLTACNGSYSYETNPSSISSDLGDSMVLDSIAFDECQSSSESELLVSAYVVSYEGFEYNEDCDPSLPGTTNIATLIRIVSRESSIDDTTAYDVDNSQNESVTIQVLGSVTQSITEMEFTFRCVDVDKGEYRSVWSASNTSITTFTPSSVEIVDGNTRNFNVGSLNLEDCMGYIKTTASETFESKTYTATEQITNVISNCILPTSLSYGAQFSTCNLGQSILRGESCEIECETPYYYSVQDPSNVTTTYDCVLGQLREPNLECKKVCEDAPIVDYAFDLGHCRWTKSDSSCKLICIDGYSAVEPEGGLMYCYNGSWDYGEYEGMDSPDWCRRECSIPNRLGNGIKFVSGSESYCVAGTSEMPSTGTCDVECETFFVRTIEHDEVTNLSRSYISCTEGLYIDHTIECTFMLTYYITGGMVYPVDAYVLVVASMLLIFCVVPLIIHCIRIRVNTMSLNSIEGVQALIEGDEQWIRKCIESVEIYSEHSAWNYFLPCCLCCCRSSSGSIKRGMISSVAKRVVTEKITDLELEEFLMFMSHEKCLTVRTVLKKSKDRDDTVDQDSKRVCCSPALELCLRICRGKGGKIHSRAPLLKKQQKKKRSKENDPRMKSSKTKIVDSYVMIKTLFTKKNQIITTPNSGTTRVHFI